MDLFGFFAKKGGADTPAEVSDGDAIAAASDTKRKVSRKKVGAGDKEASDTPPESDKKASARKSRKKPVRKADKQAKPTGAKKKARPSRKARKASKAKADKDPQAESTPPAATAGPELEVAPSASVAPSLPETESVPTEPEESPDSTPGAGDVPRETPVSPDPGPVAEEPRLADEEAVPEPEAPSDEAASSKDPEPMPAAGNSEPQVVPVAEGSASEPEKQSAPAAEGPDPDSMSGPAAEQDPEPVVPPERLPATAPPAARTSQYGVPTAVSGAPSRSTLYPHRADPGVSDAIFSRPGCEYRATPFWSWNNKLEPEQLCRQIEQLKRMGMGGFHMHPRTGLATEYLGDAYMQCVKRCVEKARKEHMLAWLYDEDRWPSGFAGGLVTSDRSLRTCSLRFTPQPYDEQDIPGKAKAISRASSERGGGERLARYRVELSAGRLVSYERLADDAPDGDNVWYAYKETAQDSTWFNNQAYVDTLNPKAIEAFRDVTHARYAEVVGDAFGSIVPAIFTDEPQVVRQKLLPSGNARADCIIAYTHDLEETYSEAWGASLLDQLPELFWERADGTLSPVRWRYRDHVSERFASAFADTLGNWCGEHGIALTGHMMEEPTLGSQTSSIIEAMRSYRSFQLPGIDMLCDSIELTTAKQAASAAHQFGREGVLSELYGVTNWDFPFRGHKRQADWQAALGVTVRVPHLTWVSMLGNAKRDYPASIGYQSPWYEEYPLVEDHLSRVSYVLTRGKPRVRVAVIHPIESYWLSVGPASDCRSELASQQAAFDELAQGLLYGCLDFDYICEGLLPSQSAKGPAKRFNVGHMSYEIVVVPALRTIRSTTLDRLEAFAAAGGQVIFAGRIPDHVDALPNNRAATLAAGCPQVPCERAALLAALDNVRDVSVLDGDGSQVGDVLHQVREDGLFRHLFLCCTRKDTPPDARVARIVRLKGSWQAVLNDTMSGRRTPQPVRHEEGDTLVPWNAYAASSLLLTLSPTEPVAEATALPAPMAWRDADVPMATPAAVELHEPNVLLLDMGEFRIGDAPWRYREEIMRAENTMRADLGWPAKTGQVAQPWAVPPSGKREEVSFRFFIESDIRVEGAQLAIEQPTTARITLDGTAVEPSPEGWWVDEAIETVPLPVIEPGRRELVVTLPMTPEGSLEWMYLLGDFGVALEGRRARLIPPVRELAWGDWTSQGLPFYAGNLTYRTAIEVVESGTYALRLPSFGAPLLSVSVDGKLQGRIAFEPYRLELGTLQPGQHEIAVTAFGCRVNAFGAVHNCHPGWSWWGPGSWSTKESSWSYDYTLCASGLLDTPVLEVAATS